jgi:dienelactone hydrolase
MRQPLLLVLLPLVPLLISCSRERKPDIKTEEVAYTGDSITMKGYIAYDASLSSKRPGVLVVHEWWGHNEYARKRARMLAELGYVAFALDLYGGGQKADHPEDAGKFAAAIMQNMPGAKARFLAALDVLKSNALTDPTRLAAIGYCFGGGIVLNMARLGVDLKGVVSFHGSLGAMQPAQAGAVKAAVLVCNGADDPFTTTEQIEAFKKEMTDANVRFTFVSYTGAKHSFTNPDADTLGKKFNIPLAYNASADTASWSEMRTFFSSVFAH